MNELDIGSGGPFFACGHANPSGNHYCNVCGVERSRTCSRCRASNRDDASFCGGCGARLVSERAVPEGPVGSTARPGAEPPGRPATYSTRARSASAPSHPPGSEDDLEHRQATTSNGGGRRADPLFSRRDDASPEDEDGWLGDERELRDGRRKRALLAAVVIATVVCAVVLSVGQFGLAWYGGVLERLVNRLVAERSAPPVESLTEATPATAPAALPDGKLASAEPSPPPPTRASAAPDARESPGPTLPPASRSGNQQLAEREEEAPSGGADQTGAAPPPQTSEERMAAFLVAELGPAPAAAKALFNAAWYDAGRSEYAYWHGVAEAIRRREAH